jgi:hypothetical protein
MALQFISVLMPEFYWFTHPCARSGIVQPCQMPGRPHWRVFWIQGKGMAPANFSLYLHIYNIFDIRILNFSFQLTHPDLRFITRFFFCSEINLSLLPPGTDRQRPAPKANHQRDQRGADPLQMVAQAMQTAWVVGSLSCPCPGIHPLTRRRACFRMILR